MRAFEGMSWAKRLWLKVHEPRTISALYFILYAGLAAGGITALIIPPTSIEGVIGQVAMNVLSLLLILGGILGAPSSLLGSWWMERLAVVAVGFSTAIYASIIITLQVQSSSGNRMLQLSMILALLIMQAVRWERIRKRPYDPDRRP